MRTYVYRITEEEETVRKRIPFGYRIENGFAVIEPCEAEMLRNYFTMYINGMSMKKAAETAGIHCSQGGRIILLNNRTYLGTDYYPQILEEGLMESAWREHEKRKAEKPKDMPKGPRIFPVPIETQFEVDKGSPAGVNDPKELALILYNRIHGKKLRADASGVF